VRAASLPDKLGLGMSSRAQYYWRQADICMRLSLLSEDGEVAELLINKAMQLMSQAESVAAEDEKTARLNGDVDGKPDGGRREGEPH
jgi:hypothetical protein